MDTYVNGGHEPPILLSPAGGVVRLGPTGPALGIVADQTFEVRRAQLDPGDVLLGFTDGVTESRGPSQELFGEKRLLGLLDPPPESAASLLARIEASLVDHRRGEEPFDDVAMLALRRLR